MSLHRSVGKKFLTMIVNQILGRVNVLLVLSFLLKSKQNRTISIKMGVSPKEDLLKNSFKKLYKTSL